MTKATVAGSAIALALLGTSTSTLANRDLVQHGKSWSIQLQGDAQILKKRNADVAVVDPDEVKNPNGIKTKANGGKRAVLAYISVGESEDYRADVKGKGKTSWATNKSTGWAGNRVVKYWDPEWKRIVKARVRKALAAGYDGVYLDRIDAYEQVKAPGGSRKEMIKLVKEVAAEARGRRGNAAIAVQNAEELLDDDGYVDTIDAVGKEDLYHGVQHDGKRNAADGVRHSTKLLKKAKAKGKGVYVVEYVGGKTARSVKDEARKDGFVASTGDRMLRAATE
jgi:cysteinyl-tRNA synthetase